MAGIVLRLLILSACLCAASLYAGGVQIRAYNIDYNWDSPDKYINSFAAPGRWADATPKELMRGMKAWGATRCILLECRVTATHGIKAER